MSHSAAGGIVFWHLGVGVVDTVVEFDVATRNGARDALNAICPYYTMFPLAFPLSHLAGLNEGARVLDPFCGRGTTIFAARLLGLESCGIDSNPVATAISLAKLSDASPLSILALASRTLRGTAPDPIPDGEFWRHCYAPRTLEAILRLRAGLRDATDPVSNALRGIVLGALHGPLAKGRPSYFSNQMPRTFASKPAYSVRFWEREGMRPPEVDVVSVIQARANRYFDQAPLSTGGTVVTGDSRTVDLPEGPFDAVITSPPYFGMRTYVQDQWLRNWFVGGSACPDYVQPSQIASGTPAQFAEQLGRVWANLTPRCRTGTRLVIRFGAIRSRPCDPVAIIRSSLESSGAAWSIGEIRSAGAADAGRRQAEQMGTKSRSNAAVDESDIVCVLR